MTDKRKENEKSFALGRNFRTVDAVISMKFRVSTVGGRVMLKK